MIDPAIRNVTTEIVARNRFTVKKVTNDYQQTDGTWQTQVREVYEKGNGACVLLYNKEHRTVVLTRQFRMPTYLNGNPSGMLIEVCAGLVEEGEDPEESVCREALEETGYAITEAKKVFASYMSPGAVTEIVHCFVATYTQEMKVAHGGGHEHEQENIEVLEIPFDEAWKMVGDGRLSDAKTIMLLQHVKLHGLI